MPEFDGPEPAADGRLRQHSKADASRQRAIVALLTERSLTAAAKRAGVGERTLRRWLTRDQAFKQEVADARHAIFNAGIERVQALTAKAVDTLEDLMAERTHPATRLGAARLIIEFATNRDDAATIMTKLEELERLQKEALAK